MELTRQPFPRLHHCARVGHSKRQLYGKGQESSVLDVSAAYIHCTNNECNGPHPSTVSFVT